MKKYFFFLYVKWVMFHGETTLTANKLHTNVSTWNVQIELGTSINILLGCGGCGRGVVVKYNIIFPLLKINHIISKGGGMGWYISFVLPWTNISTSPKRRKVILYTLHFRWIIHYSWMTIILMYKKQYYVH